MNAEQNPSKPADGRSDSNGWLGIAKCNGTLCIATNGIGHSPECLAEHDATISKGNLDTPGNRHPECRYRGYKNEPLSGATKDQQAAWDEGQKARA